MQCRENERELFVAYFSCVYGSKYTGIFAILYGMDHVSLVWGSGMVPKLFVVSARMCVRVMLALYILWSIIFLLKTIFKNKNLSTSLSIIDRQHLYLFTLVCQANLKHGRHARIIEFRKALKATVLQNLQAEYSCSS